MVQSTSIASASDRLRMVARHMQQPNVEKAVLPPSATGKQSRTSLAPAKTPRSTQFSPDISNLLSPESIRERAKLPLKMTLAKQILTLKDQAEYIKRFSDVPELKLADLGAGSEPAEYKTTGEAIDALEQSFNQLLEIISELNTQEGSGESSQIASDAINSYNRILAGCKHLIEN